jgi:hypothetical protein
MNESIIFLIFSIAGAGSNGHPNKPFFSSGEEGLGRRGELSAPKPRERTRPPGD